MGRQRICRQSAWHLCTAISSTQAFVPIVVGEVGLLILASGNSLRDLETEEPRLRAGVFLSSGLLSVLGTEVGDGNHSTRPTTVLYSVIA